MFRTRQRINILEAVGLSPGRSVSRSSDMGQYRIPPELPGRSRGAHRIVRGAYWGGRGVRRDGDGDGMPVSGGMKVSSHPSLDCLVCWRGQWHTGNVDRCGRWSRQSTRTGVVPAHGRSSEEGIATTGRGHGSWIRTHLDGGLDTIHGSPVEEETIWCHRRPQQACLAQGGRKLAPSGLTFGKWAGGGGKPDTCITAY
jgi:hypothetical protein